MEHPGFFERRGPFGLADVARHVGAEVPTGELATASVLDVRPLDLAGAGDLSFIDNRKYMDALASTRASTRSCDSTRSARSSEAFAFSLAAAVSSGPVLRSIRASWVRTTARGVRNWWLALPVKLRNPSSAVFRRPMNWLIA